MVRHFTRGEEPESTEVFPHTLIDNVTAGDSVELNFTVDSVDGLQLADAEGGRSELTIESTPALAHYGDAVIYVDASDQRLISALDYGLMRAMEEGDLHTLSENDPFLSRIISDTRLPERNYIRLSHPDLPISLARVPPDLWLWPHGTLR